MGGIGVLIRIYCHQDPFGTVGESALKDALAVGENQGFELPVLKGFFTGKCLRAPRDMVR